MITAQQIAYLYQPVKEQFHHHEIKPKPFLIDKSRNTLYTLIHKALPGKMLSETALFKKFKTVVFPENFFGMDSQASNGYIFRFELFKIPFRIYTDGNFFESPNFPFIKIEQIKPKILEKLTEIKGNEVSEHEVIFIYSKNILSESNRQVIGLEAKVQWEHTLFVFEFFNENQSVAKEIESFPDGITTFEIFDDQNPHIRTAKKTLFKNEKSYSVFDPLETKHILDKKHPSNPKIPPCLQYELSNVVLFNLKLIEDYFPISNQLLTIFKFFQQKNVQVICFNLKNQPPKHVLKQVIAPSEKEACELAEKLLNAESNRNNKNLENTMLTPENVALLPQPCEVVLYDRGPRAPNNFNQAKEIAHKTILKLFQDAFPKREIPTESIALKSHKEVTFPNSGIELPHATGLLCAATLCYGYVFTFECYGVPFNVHVSGNVSGCPNFALTDLESVKEKILKDLSNQAQRDVDEKEVIFISAVKTFDYGEYRKYKAIVKFEEKVQILLYTVFSLKNSPVSHEKGTYLLLNKNESSTLLMFCKKSDLIDVLFKDRSLNALILDYNKAFIPEKKFKALNEICTERDCHLIVLNLSEEKQIMLKEIPLDFANSEEEAILKAKNLPQEL